MSDYHRVSRVSALLLAAGMAASMAVPVPSRAASRPAITLDLTSDDGARIPSIDVSDLSVAVARTVPAPKATPDAGSADKGDDTVDQASVTLDLSVLSNPALINWVGKCGANSTAELKVTSTGQTTTYVLTEMNTLSLSMNHTSGSSDGQASLTLAAKHMTINGITVN